MFGDDMRRRLIAGLPQELAAKLEFRAITMSGWYPLDWYKTLHRVSQQVTGRDDRLAFELAHVFVAQQMSGVYQALLGLISPH